MHLWWLIACRWDLFLSDIEEIQKARVHSDGYMEEDTQKVLVHNEVRVKAGTCTYWLGHRVNSRGISTRSLRQMLSIPSTATNAPPDVKMAKHAHRSLHMLTADKYVTVLYVSDQDWSLETKDGPITEDDMLWEVLEQ
jgi:hypothetical protein